MHLILTTLNPRNISLRILHSPHGTTNILHRTLTTLFLQIMHLIWIIHVLTTHKQALASLLHPTRISYAPQYSVPVFDPTLTRTNTPTIPHHIGLQPRPTKPLPQRSPPGALPLPYSFITRKVYGRGQVKLWVETYLWL